MLSLLSRRSTEATMPPNSEASPAPVTEEEGQEKKSTSSSSVRKLFKGVRRRKWGRWVSEIRVPRSRSRIWLGSYDTAEKAARAYDAALYCLRGDGARFNFPAAEIPPLSEERRLALTNAEVKAIAARHAFSPSNEAEGSTSSSSESTSAMTNVVAGTREVDCSHCWDFSCESLLLADAAAEIGGEVVSVWDLL